MKYYYEDPGKTILKTKIINAFAIDGKYYITFEDHLYYPQGGGQKGDRGYFICNDKQYPILNTVKDDQLIPCSIVEEDLSCLMGKEVVCYLDEEFRSKQQKLHTCLHLHHMVMEQVKNEAVAYPSLSTIEDGFAVNKYKEECYDLALMDEVNRRFMDLLTTDTKIITYASEEDENYRYWKCNDYVIPCGGLHVKSLLEIGKVSVQIKRKKKMISVRIELI